MTSQMSNMEAFAKGLIINKKRARYYDLSALDSLTNHHLNSRPQAHFYGGNGFTVGTYSPLLSALSEQFSMTSLAMRGYWYEKPSARCLTRAQDADMLIEFLEKTQDKPIIGMGHSQGATATAIAAAKRPDLFSQLYLIEPVTFTKVQSRLYNLTPRKLKLSREPFKSTLHKQSIWHSIGDYYQHLRMQRAYRRISDINLYVFAKQSLAARQDGSYQLIFDPEQELANYFGTPYVDDALKQLRCPYTLITGKPTLFISDKVRKNWAKFISSDQIISLPKYGHLLPMEAPELCAQILIDHYQNGN